jgi:hypothetical protein
MAASLSISFRLASSSARLRASSSDITGSELISFLPHEGAKKATKITRKKTRYVHFLLFILFSFSVSKNFHQAIGNNPNAFFGDSRLDYRFYISKKRYCQNNEKGMIKILSSAAGKFRESKKQKAAHGDMSRQQR